MFLLCYNDVSTCPPLEFSKRFEVATQVNAAILASKGREKSTNPTRTMCQRGGEDEKKSYHFCFVLF
ncbi:hypothetical protein Bca101_045683 [Brassica carinata]